MWPYLYVVDFMDREGLTTIKLCLYLRHIRMEIIEYSQYCILYKVLKRSIL
jgi:hypothetical protein